MAIERANKPVSLAVALLMAVALGGCNENTHRGNDRSAEDVPADPAAEVADATAAVREADPAQVFPLPMGPDEFTKVVSKDGACSFSMTSSDFPVLVLVMGEDGEDGGKAVMKVNGRLFELKPEGSPSDEIVLQADGVRASVVPEDGGEGSREAALHFQVDGAEELGFWGYYNCGPEGSRS
ncbi:MAG: DUF6692 family protein [Methyloligella sp. ZOD6]